MTEPVSSVTAPNPPAGIVELDADAYRAAIPGLAELTLDVVHGGSSVNRSLGWRVAGVIPYFAQDPDGRVVSATYFWKDLR